MQNGWDQEVPKNYICFSKEIHQGKRGIVGTKTTHGNNCESTLRILCKFDTMKEAKKYIKVVLMVFLEKNIQGNWTAFNPKMTCRNFGSSERIFFKI